MTSSGSQYLGGLLSGDYRLLWVSTPADWYIRTPGKRMGPHWDRIRNMLSKAKSLKMQIVMCGPPGYMWKLTPIREVIEYLRLTTVRMRLCHFRLKYDPLDTAPSGTYIQVATSYPISTKLWQCNCGGNTAHKLDWYGHTQQHAEWRNKTLRILIGHILDQVLKASVPRNAAFLSIYTRIDTNVAKYNYHQRLALNGTMYSDESL